MVYVITDGEYIKFGLTKQKLARRLAEIQNGNARKLVVLATADVPNSAKLEATLFIAYKDSYILNEWYLIDSATLGKDLCDMGLIIGENHSFPLKYRYENELQFYNSYKDRYNAINS